MATNFPTSLDNLSNPAGSDPINNPSHAIQHANVNDAIEALESKVGVTNSAVTSTLDYRVRQLETTPTYTNEMAQDAVAAALAAGTHTNITINYNDTGNSISISAAAGYTNEEAVDAVAAALTAGSGISISYNDSANTITISVDSSIATKSYVDTAITSLGNTTATTYVPQTDVGNADGVASLDSNGLIPDAQIPAGIARDSEVSSAISTEVTNRNSAISTAVNNLINSAPGTLDTLGEIATALAADESAAAALTTVVNGKVSKAGGDIIQSSLASTVPLVLKGAASQTANLQEWQNSAGTAMAAITADGSYYTNAPKFYGPGDYSARYNFGSSGTANVVLAIRGAASQTANLQEWQNSAGTVLASVGSAGALNINTSGTGTINIGDGVLSKGPGNGFTFNSDININDGKGVYASLGKFTNVTGISTVPLIAKAISGQTANLQEWQDSTGAVNASMTSLGRLNLGGAGLGSYSLTIRATDAIILYSPDNTSAIKSNIAYTRGNTGGTPMYLGSIGDTANGVAAITTTSGAGSTSITSFGVNGNIVTNLQSASAIGLIIKGAASQTANLQEWQNSSGAYRARIASDGFLDVQSGAQVLGTMSVGTGNGNAAALYVVSTYSPRIGMTIVGAASQTADLQQWQNSAGTALSKVDASGAIFTITPADSTNTTQVATTAYVKNNINNLINSAPGTLDTLGEIAAALAADESASAALTTLVNTKAPIASPTFTGTPIAPTATSGTNTTQIATTAFVKTAIDTSVQPGAVYQTSAPSSPAVGQIWIDSDEDVTTFDSNIIRRKAITATAGQTVFTADLPFIDGFEQIFMNGLLLVKTTDYATSGGNTVTLTSAAAASDVIEIVSVTGANSVNTYTQAEVNALLAANTSVAPLSISANTTLVAKKRYFVTSASALTLTLPASPALNDEIQIVDASGNASTYNITVARNANKINGGLNNLIIDTNGGWYTLLYTGATYGWKVG